MRRSCAIYSLSMAMLMCAHTGLAKDHAYTQGTLLDATVDERLHEGSTLARAIYVVQIADVVYTVQGERVSARTKDYTKGLIVGDPVEASVEGEHVFLRTPNGKDIKTNVLKRARAQRP